MENSLEKSSKKDKKDKKSKKMREEPAQEVNEESPPMKEGKEKKRKKEKKEKKSSKTESTDSPKKVEHTEPAATNGNGTHEKKKKKKKRSAEEIEEKSSSSNVAAVATPTEEISQETKKSKKEEASVADTFAPYATFDEANFPEPVNTFLKQQNFKKPTEIQSRCWPIAMAGRDMVGLAETGSGKTLAFLLPAVANILANPNAAKKGSRGPILLVIAPTRELACQTHEVAEKLSKVCPKGISSVCLYGGVPKEPQMKILKQNPSIIVATPGRLVDMLESEATSLDNVRVLVLDEADRMLDMGFEEQMRRIVQRLQGPHQTMLFSATWPRAVRKIAKDYLKNPIELNVSGAKEDPVANTSITQIVKIVEYKQKLGELEALLREVYTKKKEKEKVIVFALYKNSCEKLYQTLQGKNWPVTTIHGDKTQMFRDQAIESFKNGQFPILVATDVASRGLDIKDVKYVVNYEFPLTIEDYVHRIGRTGRAGSGGTALTFFSEENKEFARELIKVLKDANQKVPEKLLEWEHIGHKTQKKTPAVKLYGTGNWNFISTDKKVHIKFNNDEDD